jgi:lysozyme
MSAVDLAVARLKVDEGFRAQKYLDTVGKTTIGYGFNVDAGITQTAATALLVAQATELWQQLSTYGWWGTIDDARASVLVELAFNLGPTGLLHFPRMLSAIGAKDWDTAATELLDSDAARQLPARYNALAVILRSGLA